MRKLVLWSAAAGGLLVSAPALADNDAPRPEVRNACAQAAACAERPARFWLYRGHDEWQPKARRSVRRTSSEG